VPAARRFVARTLQQWNCGGVTPVATLLASEIVTNAIVHAQSNAYLRVQLMTDVLRVEVHDRTRQLPTMRHAPPEAESGRGLMLVDAYSSGWGTQEAGDGKVVWFEVPCQARDREAAAASFSA
jgi:anti-sigma regulatory factor (Ser/Thr protein kinase)